MIRVRKHCTKYVGIMYGCVFYYANIFAPANYYPRLKNYSMLSLGYINNMYIPVHGLICQIFTPIHLELMPQLLVHRYKLAWTYHILLVPTSYYEIANISYFTLINRRMMMLCDNPGVWRAKNSAHRLFP